MITSYFKGIEKKIVKKTAASKKSTSKTGAKKTASKKAASKKAAAKTVKFDKTKLIEFIEDIIPAELNVGDMKPIDSSGFSPEGCDLIIYKQYCRDMIKLMNGYVPYEIIYGAIYLLEKIERSDLAEMLNKIASIKKLNKFTETVEENDYYIPAFLIINDEDYPILELKNDLVNYYMAKSVEHEYEFDIIMIMNRGLIIKDWREKRSFIGLETGEDTLMWFFVLMSEYLDLERPVEMDFRKYIKKDVVYTEY